MGLKLLLRFGILVPHQSKSIAANNFKDIPRLHRDNAMARKFLITFGLNRSNLTLTQQICFSTLATSIAIGTKSQRPPFMMINVQ